MKKILSILVLSGIFILSCKENRNQPTSTSELTIFITNDIHAQLQNFPKVKYIIDQEKEHGDVLFLVAGDLFSGNPVVDHHEEKGSPLIDLMNRVGVDLTVIGNHEFDYGEEELFERMQQAEFDFICANVNTEGSLIPQPEPFAKYNVNGIEIAVLGLVETNGSRNTIIPSTHPWRVENFTFAKPQSVVPQYASLKDEQDIDLYLALTHLGHNGRHGALGDFQLAEQYPYFDVIIGGHSHWVIDTVINDIPILQTGSNLENLGRIDLVVENKEITSFKYTMIDLEAYVEEDADLVKLVEKYNSDPSLSEVVGLSEVDHEIRDLGCFITDALLTQLQVDLTFHNSGGIRSDLKAGDITKQDIYEILPFSNGIVVYEMSVSEISQFLKGTGSGYYFSGLEIEQTVDKVSLIDSTGHSLDESILLQVAVNDYIAAVHAGYFPDNGLVASLNDAETVIAFLKEGEGVVNSTNCQNYFRYRE